MIFLTTTSPIRDATLLCTFHTTPLEYATMAPRKAPQAPKAPRKPRTVKPSTSTPKKVRKAITTIPPRLQEILDEFKIPDQVHFNPFQPEEYRKARSNIPSSFPTQPHPFDYFSLFWTDDIWNLITTNSNRYAAFQRRTISTERQRPWTDLIPDELRVFIGATIYMGIHQEPQIKDFWNTSIDIGPLYSIPFHISLCRYEQIKRYMYISNVEEDIQQQHDSIDKWWYKLEPLASTL